MGRNVDEVVNAQGGEERALALGPDRVDVLDALVLGIDDHAPGARAAGLSEHLD